MILATGLAITVLMSAWITAAADVPFSLGTAHRNLTYCNSQQLDLYIPRTAPTRPLPIVLYVHGGGFTSGDKSDLNPTFLDALASAGYAVVSVNYRLARVALPYPDRRRQVRHQVSASKGESLPFERKSDLRVWHERRRTARCAGCSDWIAFEFRCRGVSDRTEQRGGGRGHVRACQPHSSSIWVLTFGHPGRLWKDRSSKLGSSQSCALRRPTCTADPPCSGRRRHKGPEVAIRRALQGPQISR